MAQNNSSIRYYAKHNDLIFLVSLEFVRSQSYFKIQSFWPMSPANDFIKGQKSINFVYMSGKIDITFIRNFFVNIYG